jgi:hypothetical protein
MLGITAGKFVTIPPIAHRSLFGAEVSILRSKRRLILK